MCAAIHCQMWSMINYLYDRTWPRSKRLKRCRRAMKYFRLQKDLRYRWTIRWEYGLMQRQRDCNAAVHDAKLPRLDGQLPHLVSARCHGSVTSRCGRGVSPLRMLPPDLGVYVWNTQMRPQVFVYVRINAAQKKRQQATVLGNLCWQNVLQFSCINSKSLRTHSSRPVYSPYMQKTQNGNGTAVKRVQRHTTNLTSCTRSAIRPRSTGFLMSS